MELTLVDCCLLLTHSLKYSSHFKNASTWLCSPSDFAWSFADMTDFSGGNKYLSLGIVCI